MVNNLASLRPSVCALDLCIEERLIIRTRKLEEGICAVAFRMRDSRLIVVNRTLPMVEQCEAIYHELYHHFRRRISRQHHHRNREELRARFFSSAMMLLSHNEGRIMNCLHGYRDAGTGFWLSIIEHLRSRKSK